jgi:hypothetical protein
MSELLLLGEANEQVNVALVDPRLIVFSFYKQKDVELARTWAERLLAIPVSTLIPVREHSYC